LVERASDLTLVRDSHDLMAIQRLADGIRDLSIIEECPGNSPVRGHKWYVNAAETPFIFPYTCDGP
jgi:hypothetical protein